ncbi:hypothetical protein AB0H34_28605 [Saccharopolyspora shandongensis]|uniref:hypothetical protein n=1 Tax=Saccharopolyspora shandongensis TaxID=418495 RepID=UPI0033DB67C8
MTSLLQQLPDTRPAGGAALDQILIASGSATLLTALLLLLGYGHRTGRIKLLARLAERSEHSWFLRGLPGWAALPMQLAFGSLVLALLGMYWDISLHITQGRDEGPLANIAHYPILFGLFGLFTAGMLAIVLPLGERPGRAAVRITRDWYAPTSGILLAGAGFYALLGFPLDDVWHRIFGQDVTLWGPTHLMLIGGAGLSLIALALMEREGRFVRTGRAETMLACYVRRGMIGGGMLAGLSVFQAEFDFGVPQFRLVHQPLLIAIAAGCALVVARMWVGRGGALFAVGFYVLIRGGVSVLVGPVIGELFAAVPLYVVEALCVEVAAVALLRRPLVLGTVSGLLIGTIGFASEYVWTQFAFVMPWTPDMLLEGVLMAVVGGVSGGLLGALLVCALRGELPSLPVRRVVFGGALLAIALGITNGLIGTAPAGVRATMALDQRTGQADVRLDPPAIAQDPTWLAVTSWQGGTLKVDHLRRIGDGHYRTNASVPVGGMGKTLLRLHDGRAMLAFPIHMPADAALGLPELAAEPLFTRDGQPEWQVLQRETKLGIPPWLWVSASLVVLACSVALVVSLGWGAQRVSRAISGPPTARRAKHRAVRVARLADGTA